MKSYNILLKFSNIEEENNIKNFIFNYNEAINVALQLLYDKKDLSKKSVHKLCYNFLREKFKELPSQSIIRAQCEAISIYKTIKSNKHKINKYPVKKNYSLRLDKRLYSNFTNNSIKLTNPYKLRKRVLVDFVLYDKIIELFNNYSVCDPLLFIKNNKVYLSVTFETPEITPKDDSVLGVDLGIKRIATTSEGLAYTDKEFLKQKRKLRYLKRCLQSKGTKSSKRKLKKLRGKEKNINKNFNHHLVNKILQTDKSIIVLEDLKKIKEKTKTIKINNKNIKRKKFNNRFSQISIYEIKRLLCYKAPLLGKKVETVSAYMTSQYDCRKIEKGIRKGCRYYATDGKILDADWNAAINIAYKYRPFSFIQPIDGKLKRQAVNQPANRSYLLR